MDNVNMKNSIMNVVFLAIFLFLMSSKGVCVFFF